MNNNILDSLQAAIRDEDIDGWLFSNFRHRDKLSDEILGLDPETTNSRLWIYAVPGTGSPLALVHAVEEHALDSLPGEKLVYSGKAQLLEALTRLKNKNWAVNMDPDIPVLSYLDAGTAKRLEEAGLTLTSAAPLIQRLKGLLNKTGIASHNRAATALYSIVDECVSYIRNAYRNKATLCEGELRTFILHGMEERGLVTDHPPIVAAGSHAGDPHYDFDGQGALIAPDQIIQLDLWAKEKDPDSIYADISWLIYYGTDIPQEIETAFNDLIAARERALEFIHEKLEQGERPAGAAVDQEVRKVLIRAGREPALRHRTGHGIDTVCHGSGVNIDSVEFPDSRQLLDGACFSIEPGIYYKTFGLRTEIDVYIQEGKAIVSGPGRQFKLLTC